MVIPESRGQEQEAAGHIALAVRKQRELDAGAQLRFSFSNILPLFPSFCFCVLVCTCVGLQVPHLCVEVSGSLAGIASLLPPRETRRIELGLSGLAASTLNPSRQPSFFFLVCLEPLNT